MLNENISKELLRGLLDCGYIDIDVLIEIIQKFEEIKNQEFDIGEIRYELNKGENNWAIIAEYCFSEIKEELAADVLHNVIERGFSDEEMDYFKFWIRYYIREIEPVYNYSDTHLYIAGMDWREFDENTVERITEVMIADYEEQNIKEG